MVVMRETVLRYAFRGVFCAAFVGIFAMWATFLAIVARMHDDVPSAPPRPIRVGVFAEPWSVHRHGRAQFADAEFFKLSVETLLGTIGSEVVRFPSMTYYVNVTHVDETTLPPNTTSEVDQIDALLITPGVRIAKKSRVMRDVYRSARARNLPILALGEGASSLRTLEGAFSPLCEVTDLDIVDYTTRARRIHGSVPRAMLQNDVHFHDSTEGVSVGCADVDSLVECTDRAGRSFACAYALSHAPHIVGVTFQLVAQCNDPFVHGFVHGALARAATRERLTSDAVGIDLDGAHVVRHDRDIYFMVSAEKLLNYSA